MSTILHGARLLTGAGAPAIDKSVVVIDHPEAQNAPDFFGYVGPAEGFDLTNLQADDRVVELEGYTLLPGYINVQTQLDLPLPMDATLTPEQSVLLMYRRVAEALRKGNTTLRAIAEHPEALLALRDSLDRVMLWGSRVLSTGVIPATGNPERTAQLAAQAAQVHDVLELVLSRGLACMFGAPHTPLMSKEEIAAVVQAAHSAGKPVFAHCGVDEAAREAVLCGVDCIEHGYLLSPATLALMAQKGTAFLPALSATKAIPYLRQNGYPGLEQVEEHKALEIHSQAVRAAMQAGVTLIAGTDLAPSMHPATRSTTPGELEQLVALGLSPMAAISAATGAAAKLLGLHNRLGTIATGMEADIIAVKGRPDEDITCLRNLEMVARGGRLVWSVVEGLVLDRFALLPPGYTLDSPF